MTDATIFQLVSKLSRLVVEELQGCTMWGWTDNGTRMRLLTIRTDSSNEAFDADMSVQGFEMNKMVSFGTIISTIRCPRHGFTSSA
jgi:hypothetical protein